MHERYSPVAETPAHRLTAAALRLAATGLVAGGLALAAPAELPAQEGHGHDHGDGHHHGLHFTHPLFTESVSPDRKLRLDYKYFDLGAEEEHSASVGFEYAFSRSFSVEAAVPYTFTEGAAGVSEVKLKFANFAFEDHGLLLGYGVGAGIPTAGDSEEGKTHHDDEDHDHDHGARRTEALPFAPGASPAGGIPDPARNGGAGAVHTTLGRDHWEISPFFNLGYRSGDWELVAFGTLGIPTADVPEDDEGVGISYNASALYHAGSRVDLVSELHGRGGIQGHPVGEDVVNVAPGIRWRVLPHRPLVLGLGASFPLTDRQDYDTHLLASLFYHFGG